MVVWKFPTNVEIPRHVWWFQPSEKYENQLGLFFPIYGASNQENVGNTYERLRTARILSKASRTKDGKVRLHELQRSLKRMALQKHGKRAISNTMGQVMKIPLIFLWFMMVYDTYNYSSWIFMGFKKTTYNWGPHCGNQTHRNGELPMYWFSLQCLA